MNLGCEWFIWGGVGVDGHTSHRPVSFKSVMNCVATSCDAGDVTCLLSLLVIPQRLSTNTQLDTITFLEGCSG